MNAAELSSCLLLAACLLMLRSYVGVRGHKIIVCVERLSSAALLYVKIQRLDNVSDALLS